MVARARNAECYTVPEVYWIDLRWRWVTDMPPATSRSAITFLIPWHTCRRT